MSHGAELFDSSTQAVVILLVSYNSGLGDLCQYELFKSDQII